MKPCVGDWVEVRSKEEILRTLDKSGRLEGLPFMPQMFQYCGQRFQVYKRAHKTCDTVSGRYVSRSLPDGVHLNLRCDGQAYGGCQAACLIFWKGAWLKPVASEESPQGPAAANERGSEEAVAGSACVEDDVWRATRHGPPGEETKYTCQATELLHFTSPLKSWDARQYVETYRSGNASMGQILGGLFHAAYCLASLANWPRIGRPARWLYDRVQALRGGIPFPKRKGQLPVGEPTPTSDLNLRPGDLVRVRSYQAILATLDAAGFNRGLFFDAESVPCCGKVYRVKARVEKFIDEKTGKMRLLRTPAVILEGSYCRSLYHGERLFCPRSIYTWWREIWLERISDYSAWNYEEPIPRQDPLEAVSGTSLAAPISERLQLAHAISNKRKGCPGRPSR
jgi:hypothetical protein